MAASKATPVPVQVIKDYSTRKGTQVLFEQDKSYASFEHRQNDILASEVSRGRCGAPRVPQIYSAVSLDFPLALRVAVYLAHCGPRHSRALIKRCTTGVGREVSAILRTA